jgi:hypothetical protein
MDVLVPKVGEIIGGSQREERLDVLEQRMAEQGLIRRLLVVLWTCGGTAPYRTPVSAWGSSGLCSS